MIRSLMILIALILLFAVIGCNDDSVPTVTGTEEVTFPHKVGSLWTYEYTEVDITGIDTTVVTIDTVNVVVIRDTILATGDSATIWVFRYGAPDVPDTQLVVMTGDSVKLRWDTLSISGTQTTIILPINTGLTWVGGVGQTDTTTVSGPFSVSVKGGSFSGVFGIQRKWAGFEESEETDIWLMPDVGIVWYRFHLETPMFQPAERFQSWELLSYDLP